MRARLVFWNVVAIGVILGLMGITLRFELRRNLLSQVDRDLEREVSAALTASTRDLDPSEILHGVSRGSGSRIGLSERPMIPKAEGKLIQVLRNRGDQITLHSELSIPKLIPVEVSPKTLPPELSAIDLIGFRQAKEGAKIFHDFTRDGEETRSLSEPVRSRGRILAVAQSTRDLTPVGVQLHQLDLALSMLLPVALFAATLTGTALVVNTMRPLRRLTESARRLDPDLSEKRLPTVGSDEFADLAAAFNEAFDRTAAAFDTQRKAIKQLEQFTGDAGHELRTPLAAIKGSVSFLLGSRKWSNEVLKSLEMIDKSSDRMNNLIGDLLLLARQDGRQCLHDRSPVLVTAIVEEALSLLPRPSHVAIEVSVERELTVLGDAGSLIRVFTNLISNAFTYANSSVRIEAFKGLALVNVAIHDDGDGIAPEHLTRLGERFYRPDSARARRTGGTGLGLAIAKSLVEVQGGKLSIESQLAKGTTVHLQFLSP